jgi:hypothetical protein
MRRSRYPSKETRTTHRAIKQAADIVLSYITRRFGGMPGAVAMATDRNGNIYEGASGKRELGKDQPMTIDSVFAFFSTTRAICDTAAGVSPASRASLRDRQRLGGTFHPAIRPQSCGRRFSRSWLCHHEWPS